MKNQEEKYIQATGRHKTAIAQVRLIKGSGKITINDRAVQSMSDDTAKPLKMLSLDTTYDLSIKVSGGGEVGQNKAIRLGIARAIVKDDQESRTTLKKAGMLKRDPRSKERKKYGLKSARRSPQWSKR